MVSDFLADAVRWLHEDIREECLVQTTVTYRRGELSVQWDVSIGRHENSADHETGAYLRWEELDLIGDPEKLLLDGKRITPQVRDEFTWVSPSGVTMTYEVMPIEGEAEWRHSDPHGHAIRIHGKRTALVPPVGPLE